MTDNSYIFEILNFSKVNSKTSVDRNVTSIFKRYSSFILYHKIEEISIVQICLIRKIDFHEIRVEIYVRNVAQWYYEIQLFNQLLFLTQNSLMSC